MNIEAGQSQQFVVDWEMPQGDRSVLSSDQEPVAVFAVEQRKTTKPTKNRAA